MHTVCLDLLKRQLFTWLRGYASPCSAIGGPLLRLTDDRVAVSNEYLDYDISTNIGIWNVEASEFRQFSLSLGLVVLLELLTGKNYADFLDFSIHTYLLSRRNRHYHYLDYVNVDVRRIVSVYYSTRAGRGRLQYSFSNSLAKNVRDFSQADGISPFQCDPFMPITCQRITSRKDLA